MIILNVIFHLNKLVYANFSSFFSKKARWYSGGKNTFIFPENSTKKHYQVRIGKLNFKGFSFKINGGDTSSQKKEKQFFTFSWVSNSIFCKNCKGSPVLFWISSFAVIFYLIASSKPNSFPELLILAHWGAALLSVA